MGKEERRRLEIFEMWWYGKLLKISSVDKVTNEKILKLVKEKRSLYASINRRRERLIGHTFRHEQLAETILEGTVEGRKLEGRQRLEYVKQL